MQLADALLWIEGTALARFMVATPGAYPLASALHLLGIALVLGSIVPVDLRLLRVLGPQVGPALPTLVNLALAGFAVAATTGVLLASVRIVDYAANPAFQAKMLILVAAGANAILLRLLSGARRLPDMAGQPAGWAAGMASLSLWTATLFAGRWIAFT